MRLISSEDQRINRTDSSHAQHPRRINKQSWTVFGPRSLSVDPSPGFDPIYVVPGHRKADEMDGIRRSSISDFMDVLEKKPQMVTDVFSSMIAQYPYRFNPMVLGCALGRICREKCPWSSETSMSRYTNAVEISYRFASLAFSLDSSRQCFCCMFKWRLGITDCEDWTAVRI